MVVVVENFKEIVNFIYYVNEINEERKIFFVVKI